MSDYSNIRLSLFTQKGDKVVGETTMSDFLSGERWKAQVLEIRRLAKLYGSEAQARSDYQELMKQLPGVALSGVFTSHRDDALVEYSGFIGLEFKYSDNSGISNPDNIEMVLRFRPEVAAILTSTQGDGVLAIMALKEMLTKRTGKFPLLVRNSLVRELALSGLKAVTETDGPLCHLFLPTYDDNPFVRESVIPYKCSGVQKDLQGGGEQTPRLSNPTPARHSFIITEQTVQRVKETVSLADVVSETVHLRQAAGGRLIGCCPFHNEKTASFTVYPDGHYYCYGCGKGGDVITYVQERDHLSFREAVKMLAGRAGGIDDTVTIGRRAQRVQEEKNQPVQFIPYQYVERSQGESVFTDFLEKLIDKPSMRRVMEDYHLGCTRRRETIFWQIDREGRVHQGKIVPYMRNGHRDKSQGTHIDSVAYKLRLKHFEQCLFGEHLLKDNDKPIALVEAEKTAVICSAIMPQYVWVATGGKGNFKEKMLLALRGKMVSVFPDYDAYDEWRRRAAAIQGVTMMFSNVLQQIDFPDIDHADIADVLVSLLQQKKIQPVTTGSDPIMTVGNLCKNLYGKERQETNG